MPESKPHCVFVLPSLGGGGAERVVLNLMRLIDTSTYDRSLIVIDGSGALSNPVAEGVTINDLAMSRLRTAMPKLLAGLRRLRPALVFSTLAHVNLALLASRPLLPRTCLICREASLPSLSLDRMSWPGVMRLACRKLYPQGDLLIAPSCAKWELLAIESKYCPIPSTSRLCANVLHHRSENPAKVRAMSLWAASTKRRVSIAL